VYFYYDLSEGCLYLKQGLVFAVSGFGYKCNTTGLVTFKEKPIKNYINEKVSSKAFNQYSGIFKNITLFVCFIFKPSAGKGLPALRFSVSMWCL